MPAYMLFIREDAVTDAAAMAIYSAANRANAASFAGHYGIRPLSIYPAVDAVEGVAPDGLVLLEFPTADAARAWYDSPEYQASLPHRQQGATYRALLFDGLPTRVPETT